MSGLGCWLHRGKHFPHSVVRFRPALPSPSHPAMLGLGYSPPLPLPPRLLARTMGAGEDSLPHLLHQAIGEARCTLGRLVSRTSQWLAPGPSGNSGLCLVTSGSQLFAAQPWRQPVPSRVAVTACSGQVACATSRPGLPTWRTPGSSRPFGMILSTYAF